VLYEVDEGGRGESALTAYERVIDRCVLMSDDCRGIADAGRKLPVLPIRLLRNVGS